MELGQRKPDFFRSEFEQAIFQAAYDSRQQRLWRRMAMAVLVFKHGIRGLLFSWPAYVLALAIAQSSSFHAMTFLVMLVPAVILSLFLLVRGVRDDYQLGVENVLLRKGFMRMLIWPGARYG